MQLIPPFTLYGLVGCPHCFEAEKFLKERNTPFSIVIANNDPIIAEGVRKITQKEEYPVLVYHPEQKIVSGWKKTVYEQLVRDYFLRFGPSTTSFLDSGH